MRIAIHTASGSVARTLERMIVLANHSVATSDAQADLAVVDSHHPAERPVPVCPILTLDAPLHPQQLMQRLITWQSGQTVALGHGWVLDVAGRRLQHSEGETLTLTEKECGLLHALVAAHPLASTREAVLDKVWGMGDTIDTHTLETHIYRLRGKLSALPNPPGDIVTEGGAYRWSQAV